MSERKVSEKLILARHAVLAHQDTCIECHEFTWVTVCVTTGCTYALSERFDYGGRGVCAHCLTAHYTMHYLAGKTVPGAQHDEVWKDAELEEETYEPTETETKRVHSPSH